MFIPTSSEFVALCRAQIALLTQGLGASLSVVYLTQELVKGAETRLVAVAAYPETAADWQGRSTLQFPPATIAQLDSSPRLLADSSSKEERITLEPVLDNELEVSVTASDWIESNRRGTLVPQRQVVLPLIHEEVVMGLLVTERSDRAWNEWERNQIQQIANTLALACVLDQRYQWLDRERRQQRLIQEQQHDILDNLLHQFRNSLTALQTFSKLILKRLLPGDANREIVASIAREAARLKDLSEQLESATVGTDEEDVTPLSLPPAVEDWKGNSPTTSELEATLPDVGGVPLLPGAGVLAEAPLLLQPCSVIEVLEPLLASARTIAQERNLTLHADLPPNLPLVEANVQALREVCNNLIENALKYTNPGGQIWVQCQLGSDEQSRESWVEISVSDTGPGISSEDLPHIFERRFRGAQAQSGIPGSGLGLSIARALVEQMHGTIQVSSPAWMPRSEDSSYDLSYNEAAKIGPGTRFTARLPAIREQ